MQLQKSIAVKQKKQKQQQAKDSRVFFQISGAVLKDKLTHIATDLINKVGRGPNVGGLQ